MNLDIPIYVEGSKPAAGPLIYRARPLFFTEPEVRGQHLDRLLAKLAQDLGRVLSLLGRATRHDALGEYTFAPRLGSRRLDLTLVLRRSTLRCRFLFVVFRHFDRRLAFTPSVPGVWFDLVRKEDLATRATEVLTKHFRESEREDADLATEAAGLNGSAFITTLAITIHPPKVPPAPKLPRFLMLLGDDTPADGATELRRVGRCLDWQYPDDLDRSLLRDAELAELTRCLQAPERRPVLLVGPNQVGKSALVHEYVFRQVAGRKSPFRDRNNVWLLSPSRLISGMSYVGQWEDRLLAILKEARKREHVLYFDDLIGLFHAGQSGSSSLSVASVLKPYLERGEVRVLAEIAPPALRVLRERDRGFADLFQLLPLREPDESETLRILIAVQRQLESQHNCRFDLDTLPTVIDLQRRYQRTTAFPGKAATFLRQLAAKHRDTATVTQPDNDRAITRQDARNEFHARSGLSATFLDREARLSRAEVLQALARGVVGQEAALEAAADAIAIAKARLNDPSRPLASFLFLGPTGVGKTQTAKALAGYLFGDPERLLRFDLNGYNTPGAAARLVGTFQQPEGLLTAAVRRQPFSVILFDEVEKADPEVFDLLLQVLGDGRLTDALGRTADFTNTLIVLTSNLGVREAEGSFGFRQDDRALEAQFVRAAEGFFRPEFFNRLDRVLPFQRLNREQVGRIASGLLREIFGREGLAQRRCLLQVETAARERIVDLGYDPVYGARALKRSIEQQLTRPLAAQLAAIRPGTFTVVRVYAGPEQLAVQVQPLEQVASQSEPTPTELHPARLLPAVRQSVRRIEADLATLQPVGPVTLGQVDPQHLRYFAVREQMQRVREIARRLDDWVEAERAPRRLLPSFAQPDVARRPHWYRLTWHQDVALNDLAAALDINEYLSDLAETARKADADQHAPEALELLHQVALLQTMADAARSGEPETVLVHLSGRREAGLTAWCLQQLWSLYLRTFRRLQLDVVPASPPPDDMAHDCTLLVQGVHAWPLAHLEGGTHLCHFSRSPVEPIQVVTLPVPAGSDPTTMLRERQARRSDWLQAVQAGRAQLTDDPEPYGPVIRLYTTDDPYKPLTLLDFRCRFLGSQTHLADYLLAALPLPAELREAGF
ncbi:MAG: ATP-dependent Clp protease ATP-binding subunit [Planctomycetia bacterium]|nr:ATP-dependent Clp protease ATP-binding subunit [Planctomycetia bacterium]